MSRDRLADIGVIMLDRAFGIGNSMQRWYQRLGMMPIHWDHARNAGLIWRGDDPYGFDGRDQSKLARANTIAVEEFERAVVLRNGAFFDVLEPGLWEISKDHRLRGAIQVTWIDMRQVDLKWGVGGVVNRDGVTVGAHGMLYVQVAEPQPFFLQVVGGQPGYAKDDLQAWLRAPVAGSMRAELASYTVQGLMSERDAFQESIVRRLSPVLEAWGLALRSIEIEDFSIPQEYRDAAQAATITTLDRNAAVIAAQAAAEITRIEASASADRRLLEGAADAQYFALLQAQGIDPVRIEWIRALKEYADHPGSGVGDMYKPQLFLQAGQILADPTVPANVKQDVRRMLPTPQLPQMTDPAAPLVQHPSVALPQSEAAPQEGAAFVAPPSPSLNAASAPQTREEIQQLLDGLDAQLAEGKLSEAAYDRLYARWQARLDALGQHQP